MTQEENDLEARFGNEVKEARKLHGWTQEKLRRSLLQNYGIDLSPTAMTRLEGGKRPIRLSEAVALAQLLGLHLESGSFAGVPPLVTKEQFEEAVADAARTKQEFAEMEAQLNELQSAHASEEAALRSRLQTLRMKAAHLATALYAYDNRRAGELSADGVRLSGER